MAERVAAIASFPKDLVGRGRPLSKGKAKVEREYEYGYVYVFAVSDLPRVKVGYTNTTPQARLAQLNAPNGGAGSHRLEYVASWLCRDPAEAEAKAHARLQEFRCTDSIGTEFFDLGPIAATSICSHCLIAHDLLAKPFGLARSEVRALIKGEKKLDAIPEPERWMVKRWLGHFSARRSAAWEKACGIIDASLHGVPSELRPSTFKQTEMAQPIFRTLFPELRLLEELESESPPKKSGLVRLYEIFSEKSEECIGGPLTCAEVFYRALGEPDASEMEEQKLRLLVGRFIEMRRDRQ